MKKFYLLFSILLCCLAMRSFAQTITFTQPAPAVDGQPQTITAIGETSASHLDKPSVLSSIVFRRPGDPDPAIPEYFTLVGTVNVVAFNCVTLTPTTITFTLSRVFDPADPSLATVQLPMEIDFSSKSFNCNGTSGATAINYIAPFRSYPAGGHTTFSSMPITQTLARTTCSPPSTGIPFSNTLAAGHNTSTTSQADADNQALTYYNANKATWANTGSCTTVAGVAFPVTNNSLNSLSITFQKVDGTIPNNIGGVIAPGTSGSFIVPPSIYNIIISPGGMPVSCTLTFNNGLTWPNAPGHTFMNVNVGAGSGTNPATSLLATKP